MADLLFSGFEVEMDEEQAIDWYRKAAEQDDARALYVLGVLHYYGEHVRKNTKKGIRMLRRAAELGSSEAADLSGLYGGAATAGEANASRRTAGTGDESARKPRSGPEEKEE